MFLKINLGVLSDSFSDVIGNYASSGEIEIKNITLANVANQAVSVDLNVVRGGVEFSLLSNVEVLPGKTLVPLFDGLVLESGDYLEGRCSVPEGVHFSCSWQAFELAIEESVPRFNQFVELEVDNGMALSSDNFVALVKDPQLLLKMEAATRSGQSTTCFMFPHDQPCPENYEFAGQVADCVESCDKVCCPVATPSFQLLVCGRFRQGAKGYNDPWDFHVDPDSISVAFRSGASADSLGATLQEIQGLALSGDLGDEGREYCFPIRDKLSVMNLVGPDHCVEPLEFSANKEFDPELGRFIQLTSCSGYCENLSENECLDSFLAEFLQEQDADDLEFEQSLIDKPEDELLESFIDNHEFIFDGLEGDLLPIPMEDFEDFILSIVNSSSSSEDNSNPFDDDPFVPAFDHDSTPVSTVASDPSNFSLNLGENFIFSIVGGFYENTYLKFNLDPQLSIVEAYAVFLGSATWEASLQLEQGTQFSGDSILADLQFGSEGASDLEESPLPLTLPLAGGDYSMKISSNFSEVEFVVLLVVE